MERFTYAFQSWNETPVPPGSTNDAIDEFHAELLQWDAFVADLAVPHARGGEVVRPVYDFGGAMANVRSRMRWHRQVHPADAEIVDRYLHYLDLVADTYSALRDARGWSEPG
jgi:hypothetical protein